MEVHSTVNESEPEAASDLMREASAGGYLNTDTNDVVTDDHSTSYSLSDEAPVTSDPFDCSWFNHSINNCQVQQLAVDGGDDVTLKSNSSSTCVPDVMTAGATDSSLAGTFPEGSNAVYSRFRDSAPSSVCSASPYESPTHVLATSHRSDTASNAVYDDSMCSRPDSLSLQRSMIQQRERQWLIAKKGSYSSLSECDSSHSGSMEALIEAATSTPLHSQGTVAMDGDMITFVADGINELIKRSRGGMW